ncbi:NUDIX hydrolase [Alphaproteobacteria bacterium]|nr:NUDIX hydrolase [Alphaproteobacteria bacterium]
MRGPDRSVEVFHSLALADYVTVLALTPDNKVPLVRQYRPAIQSDTIELPGGILDHGDTPAECAERELFEETGYRTTSPLIKLGCLATDVGRLENRLWCYFAVGVEHQSSWQAEEGVEPLLVELSEFKSAVCNSDFDNALHIALIGLAVMQDLI